MAPSDASIVLAGQGHWCRSLAEGLEHTCGLTVAVVPFDSLSEAMRLASWATLARARTIVLVGFRPGAHTVRGRAFDLAFSLVRHIGAPKQLIRYWIGTDVYHTVAGVRSGGMSRRLARAVTSAEHIAGSEPLTRDLASIGIDAATVDFPWGGAVSTTEPPALPERFTVLTYIPDARPAFYGAGQLIAAALALPHVRFLVVGGNGTWAAERPANLEFLGWQKDMEPWYAAASCVVRMVEHDSIGGTVGEALSRGRTVVYSRPLEHTVFAPFGDARALIDTLSDLAASYERASLDVEAMAWAREFFDPGRRFRRLAEVLSEGCSPVS